MSILKEAPFVGALLLALIIWASPVVFAKNTRSLQNLNESLEQLTAIKNNSQLPLSEKSNIETEARKTTFNRIIELDLEEIASLKKKVEKYKIGQKYLDLLDEYYAYHELIKDQINQGISLNELVDLAERFKSWRNNFYSKEINKILNLVLAYQNQAAVKISEIRLGKITKDFKLIKSLIIITKWNSAEKLLSSAKNAIEGAKKISSEIQGLIEKNDYEQIEALVTKSTQKISEAYQNFIALSELVE